jgi:hypothetical protein
LYEDVKKIFQSCLDFGFDVAGQPDKVSRSNGKPAVTKLI